MPTGTVLPEAREVLRAVARTGWCSPPAMSRRDEIFAVVDAAFEEGV